MERMTAEQYRKHLQGKINRAQGARFEDIIDAACLYYDAEGYAFIEKTPEPMKIIRAINRQRGTFETVFSKAAQPDYKGTMKHGTAVCFDAKHTESDRIKQDAVSKEQWEALDKHQALGALCFILVSLGHRYYRVPWEEWKEMKAIHGHKYMDAEDLALREVEVKHGVVHFLGLDKETREFFDRQLKRE